MTSLRSVLLPGVIFVSLCGCGMLKKESSDSSSAEPESSGSKHKKKNAKASDSSAAESPASAAKHPYFDEAGRQGKCEFVKYEGTGKDRKAMFKLTAPPGKEVDYLQTWEFYYDKDGKHLERYPHATSIKPEPQALGQEGDKIPKDTALIECEITRITYKDKTFWFNGNLVRNEESRPKGGYTEAELKTHTGERVSVEVVDAKKGKVKLKNLSDKPVKSLEVDIIPFLADGTHKWIVDFGVDAEIKPGETVEKEIKVGSDPVPDFKTVEGTAPEVRFADGTKFINHNLSGFDLPDSPK